MPKLFDLNNNISTIYGPPGSGKTTMAMISAIDYLKENKKVLFMDTEQTFSIDRFIQLSKDKKLLDNLLLNRVSNFKEQQMQINGFYKIKNNISLVVVDTIGNHYRMLVKSKPDLANRMLASQYRALKDLSSTVPVLILNQVYENPVTNETIMVGGNISLEFADQLIELKKDPRQIIFKKENKSRFFRVSEEGIHLV
ncbi:MAG: AAA family ATPase [Nanoarchaeota archaeon]|nr:AAA family ATPase [Nanoarchaeota archaeon]MBU0962991.1 AAA family ATPase [Nanoarchaeota archaeon]